MTIWYIQIALKKGISIQLEDGSHVGTMLFVSLGDSCVENFNLKAAKRKRVDIDRIMASSYDSQVQGFSCSPSAWKGRKRSSSTDASIVPPASMDDDDCYMNLDSKLQCEPDKENVHISKSPILTPLNNLVSDPNFNFVLSQSIGPTISTITTEVETSTQHLINHKTSTVHDGLVFSTRGYGNSLITYMREASTTSSDCPFETIKNKDRSSCTKKCQFFQCLKLAKGASGLCIAHGERKRCQKDDCEKIYKGKSISCKFHEGGRRCERLGCLKSAIESTDYCIVHGCDNCCNHVNCTKVSRAMSRLCIKHGGGRRCKKDNCTKIVDSRHGLCIAHCRGKCCHHKGCTKGAQDNTLFCKSHEGRKRCSVNDCNKVVEGMKTFCKRHGGGNRWLLRDDDMCSENVHSGTQLCVDHGCGKKCAIPKCNGSTHDGTDHCSHHGVGKRCQHEGHDKCAQGWTNFCKAHGDNSQRLWGSQAKPDVDFDGPSCNHYSTSKFGLYAAHSTLVKDHCVHGGKNMVTLTSEKPIATEKMKVNSIDKLCLFDWEASSQNSFLEGRVHGGSLMTLIAKRVPLNKPESQVDGCNSSNQVSSLTMNYECL